jgi:hypothetical protein
MAEIKNSFLKSKMNKDLDDRLVPNGEYRDAQNISVGKSEADDIGALENVLGNTLVPGTNLGINNLEIIGHYEDDNSNTIYLFLTDNSTNHFIYKYNNGNYTKLVEGTFLNFNTANPISGVNLVENLLFFTDNRNQPRKINVSKTLGYYTKENQISVAKYNPYDPITLLTSVEVTQATSSGVTITLASSNANIKKGMLVIVKQSNSSIKIPASEYLYVVNIVGTAITLNVAPSSAIIASDVVTFLATTMTGKDITFDFNQGADWPGDPDFLEDLFVRFSYRFKFDDQEYSLMAPFTQPAFIPQQKGYFLADNEDAAFRSTILDFMQNGVQNVKLVIPLPDIQSKLGNQNDDTYKITEIDILYKESDARAVKVLDTVKTSNLSDAISTYTYDYQSRKPYKTLPERQTIRVYDKVPVRALSQEVAGNRVMYGNFQSQHTPPASLNYNIGANAKSTTAFTTWAEYPNHTLKQNRNYQVGFVLADKFGRQSSVILSSVDDGVSVGGSFFGGSTFYHPYKSTTQNLKEWFGDALKVVINTAITSSPDSLTGTPGLYADQIGNGFNTTGVATTIVGNTFTFTLAANQTDVPVVNSYLRGEYTDFVKVTNVSNIGSAYTITTDGEVNNFLYLSNNNNPDVKFAYNLNNPLGWYSYKIVVKQQEQDYYNCYFPGFLDGYPAHSGTSPYPTNEDGKTGHTVLINDNINKVPRDLSQVGPEQKQFRSSVRLYGRVNNTATDNVQFFPVNISGTQILPLHFTADAIATALDLNINYDELTASSKNNFYQLDTNPLITRLATLNSGTTTLGVLTGAFQTPFLSIAETEPDETLLQLFYETSTAGLIADLNADINTGFNGVSALSALSYSQNESMAASTNVTGVFYPQNNQGSNFANTDIANNYPIMTITDGTGANRTADFSLITSGTGYILQTANNQFVYGSDGSTKEVYTIEFQWKTNAGDESTTTSEGSLDNIAPLFAAGASLPDVTVSASATSVVTRNGFNGSASNNADDLKYSITAGNTGSHFSINSTTGEITKSSSTPIGVYTLTLKIEDAVSGGVAQTGSLSITKTQKITVGADAVNSGVISNCYASRTANLPGTNQITAPYDATTVTGAWYLSDSTLTASDLPVTPSTNTTESNFLHKLGSALSQGTVVFSCNMQQSFTNNDGGLLGFVGAGTQWKIWYRDPSGANTWNQVADLNNDNMGAPGVTAALNNTSFNSTKYAQAAFAFNQTGEYCIAAIDAETTTAAVAADALVCWVNSNDLYYSTCVVENGSDVTDGNTPKRYQYDLGSSSTSFSCTNTGNTAKYAPHPYGNYVTEFYNDTALSQIFTPSSAEYYSFTTDVATEPFSSIRYTAKYNTSGTKISPNIVGDPCNDQYARACQGTFTTCAHPVMGGVGW